MLTRKDYGFSDSAAHFREKHFIFPGKMNSSVLLIVLCAVSSRELLVLGGNVGSYVLQGNQKYSEEKHGSAASQDKAVERPLLVGSFNVQTLGKKKLSNSDVSRIVEEVVLRYDLIVIIEMMTNSTKLLDKFLWDVNRFAPEGVTYNMSISTDPSVNEFCAVFYRVDKLSILNTESYHDPTKFYRRPYFVLFNSPTLRDMQKFGIIAYHVKPSEAVREINALAQVYDLMKVKYNTEDILLMGDFNADCDYVKEGDWDRIELWTRPEFTWAIGQNIDTTTNYKSCALDRFVYAGENMSAGVILPSARVFNFQEEFFLTMSEVRKVSDHWPIEIKIRGKMSTTAEMHLSSDACIIVRDSRSQNITTGSIQNATKLGDFQVIKTINGKPLGITLQHQANYLEDMLDAILRLRKNLPEVVTKEQEEAIIYKINHGALNDGSSYSDVPEAIFKTILTNSNGFFEISICKMTAIN